MRKGRVGLEYGAIARSCEVTPATDRYALAVVAYEMLAGQVPFQAPSTMALLYQIAHDPPPPLAQICPELAGPAEQVLQCGLAKSPQARFPTCTAFVQSLEQALLGGPDAQLRLPAVPAPTRRAALPSVPATRRGLPAWVWTLVGILTTLLVGVSASWLRIEVLSTYPPEAVGSMPPRNFVAISGRDRGIRALERWRCPCPNG